MDYRASFVFSKTGLMKYISHLDLMRLFMRAFQRGKLPVKITQGFSPHIKLSIKRALKLGLESENEEAQVMLKQHMSAEEFLSSLSAQMPQGIIIKQAIIHLKPNT